MSDTPETDAVEFVAQPGMMPPFNTTPSAHARRLERERDEARELVGEMREAIKVAREQLASEKSTRNAIIAKGVEMERQLAEARAEVARLQMELDTSCNAEELRQVRKENARLQNELEKVERILYSLTP